MNNDLIECKTKAKELVASENPPLKPCGRKKGYMQLMKELWDDKGYGVSVSVQNLRDQAARIEKTLGDTAETIRNKVGRRIEEQNGSGEVEGTHQFIYNSEIINSESLEQSSSPNLHEVTNDQPQESTRCQPPNTEVNDILEIARPIYGSVAAVLGDFSARIMDTRIKERPTRADIAIINRASSELMKQKDTGISAEVDPFNTLWIASCVLYSVVVAYLLNKGWRKKHVQSRSGRKKLAQKDKEMFEQQVKGIRKRLSIAQAELDRIKLNRKITKKGKKNRKMLLKDCKVISTAELVNFMEKEKSS